MQNNTLELFQFTKPEAQFPAQMTTAKRAENGSVSVTLALEKRKDLAERLGLKGKNNAPALNAAMLKLTDQLKSAATGEFVKLAASDEWTGGRFVVRQSKNGQKRATLSLVSVQREIKISQEDVVKALASMKPDQVEKLILEYKSKQLVELAPAEYVPTAEKLAEWKEAGLNDEEIASEIELEKEIAAEKLAGERS
jgi:hypothetical protein